MKLNRVSLALILFVLAAATAANAGPGAVLDPPLYPAGKAKPTYYANSPAGTGYPIIDPATGAAAIAAAPAVAGDSGTALSKFVDSLPGLGTFGCTVTPVNTCNANNLGQYIPLAIADTATFPGSDYYELGLKDFRVRMHTNLPLNTDALGTGTRLRGYYQINGTGGVAGPSQYLGPIILAKSYNPALPAGVGTNGKPVRIKFVNQLGAAAAGNLSIPVDTTMMGAGLGPNGAGAGNYTQNRATLHLHGGLTPWISDGTPHQWIVPAAETSVYKKGLSQNNVPDMWFDGTTGAVIPACAGLLTCGTAGSTNAPLGGETFFWTNEQSSRLMFYHDHAYGITRLNVYAGEASGYLLYDAYEEDLISGTNVTGVNPTLLKVIPDLGGVYHYGIPLVIQDKTFVPKNISFNNTAVPATLAGQDTLWTWGAYGELWFPHVYEPNQDPLEPTGLTPAGRWDYGPYIWPPSPATNLTLPVVSTVPEAFMDTPIVNGTAYPYLTVEAKAYRFRILSVANDRSFNLQLYYAATPTGSVCTGVGGATCTEVKMIAAPDARPGGIPDPTTAGPSIVQIGTEGGFLPAPVVLPNTPISLDAVGNVANKTLLLMPAERADVVIDFSAVPVGSYLILYNDAPAALPGGDSRYDYYTTDPNQTAIGGAPSTVAGFGPNTRTIMQFRVVAVTAATSNNVTSVAGQAALLAAYNASQPAHPVPSGQYAKLLDTSMTVGGITYSFQGKSINEGFDPTYGRINAVLGTQAANGLTPAVPLGYIDAPTEILPAGGIQLWKVVHNGMDAHPIHFHLVNVQVVNRIGYDGSIKPPDPTELGWKETVRMNPLEDVVVAMKATAPVVPFTQPDSIRPRDVTMPVSAMNPSTNFGHEYVWHCHILGHEEFDLMRPMILDTQARDEILWRHSISGSNVLWYMDPTGTTMAASAVLPIVAAPWTIAARADLNADGNYDIVWRNPTSGSNVIWYMSGTSMTSSAALPMVSDPNWTIVGVGDFDLDGKPDLVWENSVTGSKVVWFMNGTTMTGSASLPADPAWHIAGVGDFNHDGKPDILWRNATTGSNVIWFMNGTTMTGSASLPILAAPWTVVGVGDYNGDVSPDILWRNTTTGADMIWYLNGTALVGTASLPTVTDTNWSIVGH